MIEAGHTPRQRALLWLGLGGGIALTLLGLAEGSAAKDTELSGAAAVVDGVPISKQRYLSALAALAVEERAPRLDVEQRRRLLDELIAEELLLARAVELDLPRSDALSRKQLVAAMVDLVGADPSDGAPSEQELRRYWTANPERFSGRRAFHVAIMFFRGDTPERARQAKARVTAGESFEAVRDELADPDPVAVPSAPLSARTLRSYLGGPATRAVEGLAVGQLSDPIRVGGGYRLILLKAAPAAERGSFEAQRRSVLAHWRAERKSETVRAYIDELRDAARVLVDEQLVNDSVVPPRLLEAARRRSGKR